MVPFQRTAAMLRISKLTDYATVILGAMAFDPAVQQTSAALAARTHIGAATVSKLLKQLHRAGLVSSTRGLHGGYQLAKPANAISAAAILDALEGPLAITDCSTGQRPCGIAQTCRVSHGWQRVNVAVRHSLQDVSLAQLAGLEPPLARLPTLDREMQPISSRNRGAL